MSQQQNTKSKISKKHKITWYKYNKNEQGIKASKFESKSYVNARLKLF